MAILTWDELMTTADFRPTESSAERSALIAWTEIDVLREYLFPVPTTTGASQTSGIGIALPGYDWLRADSMHVEPFGERIIGPDFTTDITTLPTWEKAKVTVKYVTPKYNLAGLPDFADAFNPDPVTLLQHRWAGSGEFLTLPVDSDNLVWHVNPSDSIPDDVPIAKFIPLIEHQLTWPYVKYPPWPAIRECLGKKNDALISFQTGDIDAGTLLFAGCELQREVLSNGRRAWNLTYRFSERRIEETTGSRKGWNVMWNKISKEFDSVDELLHPNRFPYPDANFLTLFMQGTA